MKIFFIRRFNDVDHIVPIVYKMAELGEKKIQVLCLNPGYDIENDFRLNFLRNKYNIKTEHVYNIYKPSILTKLVAFLICRTYLRKSERSDGNRVEKYISSWDRVKPWLHYLFSRSLSIIMRKSIGLRNYDKLVISVFNEKWAEGLFVKTRPSVLVFDWVKKQQHVTGALIKAAQKMHIPTTSVPHGLNLIANELQRDKETQQGTQVDRGSHYNMFDHFVVQFQDYKELCVKTGLSSKKTVVLGSTRYCDEWRLIYNEIVPKEHKNVFNNKEKLKVVFMEYPYNYRINKEAALDSIVKIGKLDFIDLVIKPHTRSNKLYAKILDSAGTVAFDIPSISLCNWADVIIGTSSSILLEPLLNGKVLLYPKYFHENTMYFETMNACWVVHDHKDLESALNKLKDDHSYKPYLEEDVQSLITAVVEGGIKDRKVLRGYVDFINAISKHYSFGEVI